MAWGYPTECMEDYISDLSDSQLEDLESIIVHCFENRNIHEQWLNALNAERDKRGC